MKPSSLRTVAIIFAALLSVAGEAAAQSILGTYSLVKDSDGQVPKAQSTIKITFKTAGILSLSAERPGETVNDTGTYFIRGNLITLHFKEMVWETRRQPFTLEGCNLTLPFMALKSTRAPGTSVWSKQDCSSARPAEKEAGVHAAAEKTTGTSTSVGNGQSASSSAASAQGNGGSADGGSSQGSAQANHNAPGPAPGPGPGPDKNNQSSPNRRKQKDNAPIDANESKKPSCLSCDYIPCLRDTIEQKKKLKAMYAQLQQQFSKFYYTVAANGEHEPVDILDRGKISDSDYAYLLQVFDSFREKETEQAAAIGAPPACHYDGGLNLELATNIFSCQLVPPSAADVLAAAVPCRQLYSFAMQHEGVHINACQNRRGKGANGMSLLLTPEGKAKEEIAAYDMEIANLTALLNLVEAQCPFVCGCDGARFDTSQKCQAGCPISLRCPVAAANSCMHREQPAKKVP